MTGRTVQQFALPGLLLLSQLAGCGSQAQIDKLYLDEDAGTYDRMLVVGIAADASRQVRIEELIVDTLRAEGIEAVPGHTRLGTSATLMQDEIDAAARDTQSDAILVAHLVSASVDAELEEGRVDIKSTCRGGSPVDLFLYDREELREPDEVRVAHTVTMVTNLYDTRNEKRVWTIQSTCFDKTDFDSVLRQEADAIVRQLRVDALIEPRGG